MFLILVRAQLGHADFPGYFCMGIHTLLQTMAPQTDNEINDTNIPSKCCNQQLANWPEKEKHTYLLNY